VRSGQYQPTREFHPRREFAIRGREWGDFLAICSLLNGQGRSHYERSLAIREALRHGCDEDAVFRAKTNPGDWQETHWQGVLF